jgi:hypothetical protein
MDTLLEKVKANLILSHTEDDELLQMYITAAVRYAESYQHISAAIMGKRDDTDHRTGGHHAGKSFL